MDHDFWRERWERNEIGFHQAKPNALLEKYFGDLSLEKGRRIFVPLCGKTLDIAWLLARGYRVAGAELSEAAIRQLFGDLGVTPEIIDTGPLRRYSGKDIDIFVGDIFDLTANALGPVDAVYDRAALVALPDEMRRAYARHVMKITETAPQFLLTFEYDQSEMAGPPFSIAADEVRKLFGGVYDLALMEKLDVAGGLKGRVKADEAAWLLRKR